MNRRNVIVILILLSATAWWFLHEDPEAEVRNAHQELTRLLSKPEGEASGAMLLNAKILQGMFADSCEVTGDAEMLARVYTPDEMVGTIVRIQGMFLQLDLTFHEMVIEFPTENDAIANFTAVLVGQSVMEAEGEVAVGETRAVTSRMRQVDGKWLFAHFTMVKVPES